MEFAKVNHSHIVPKAYLRNFATDEQLVMRLIGETESRLVSVRDAAVRRAFYRRTRPDGGTIDDVEWSLSHIEEAAAPLLKTLESRWPLDKSDKAVLGEFLAVQLVRGPRWRDWHNEFLPRAVAEQRAEGLTGLSGVAAEVAEDHIVGRVEAHLAKDTQRHLRMLGLIPKVGSIFASMSWTLLRFHRPLLATSDHPVVVWPLERHASEPVATRVGAGVLPTLEVRLPIAPQLALLMTWREVPDHPDPLAGRPQHARNLNAFTIAHAERQWFHLPGTSPPVVTGRLYPLSPVIHPDYDHLAARDSRLRAEVSRRIQPRIGRELERQLEVVSLRRSSG